MVMTTTYVRRGMILQVGTYIDPHRNSTTVHGSINMQRPNVPRKIPRVLRPNDTPDTPLKTSMTLENPYFQ